MLTLSRPQAPCVADRSRQAVLAAALSLLVLVLVGCNQFKRIGECTAVVKHINDAVEQIAQLDQGNESRAVPHIYTAIGRRYEELARELTELKIDEPVLRSAVNNYTAGVRTTATQCNLFATHLSRLSPDGGAQGKPKKVAPTKPRRKQARKNRQLASAKRKLKEVRKKMGQLKKTQKANRRRINSLCQPRK